MSNDRPTDDRSTPDPEHPGILDAWDGKAWIGPEGLRPTVPADEPDDN